MAEPSWSRRTMKLRVDHVDLRIAAMHAPGPNQSSFCTFRVDEGGVRRLRTVPRTRRATIRGLRRPGFGESTASDLDAVSVPFLVDVVLAVLDRLRVGRFHVVGHSMGGLTALLLADQAPDRVLTFTDVEGNLAPEDCFLSRQIVTHRTDDPSKFLAEFAARSLESVEYSSALYGSRVLTTVDPHVVRPVFESMVDLSENGELLTRFTTLPMPRMFMHGEQNAHLSYLPELARQGVEVAEVQHSGHWPMYSNPPAMWTALRAFLTANARPQE